MASGLVIVAIGCVMLTTASWAQTTPMQAFPPPFRVPQPADISPAPAQPGEMTVSEPETAIYSAPGENSQVLNSIGVGTKVMVLDSADGWTHVIAGGAEGYISSDLLK